MCNSSYPIFLLFMMMYFVIFMLFLDKITYNCFHIVHFSGITHMPILVKIFIFISDMLFFLVWKFQNHSYSFSKLFMLFLFLKKIINKFLLYLLNIDIMSMLFRNFQIIVWSEFFYVVFDNVVFSQNLLSDFKLSIMDIFFTCRI